MASFWAGPQMTIGDNWRSGSGQQLAAVTKSPESNIWYSSCNDHAYTGQQQLMVMWLTQFQWSVLMLPHQVKWSVDCTHWHRLYQLIWAGGQLVYSQTSALWLVHRNNSQAPMFIALLTVTSLQTCFLWYI